MQIFFVAIIHINKYFIIAKSTNDSYKKSKEILLYMGKLDT